MAVLLAGCGGGGGGGDGAAAAAAPETPTATTVSPAPESVATTTASTPVNGVDAASVAAAGEAATLAWTPVDSAVADDAAAADAVAAGVEAMVVPAATGATVQPAALSDSQRAAAATATAQSTTNPCNAIRPFYWEIGKADGRKVSGSVAAAGVSTTYIATTPITVASSSKWIYSIYAVEKLRGVLSTTDRHALSMISGYASFDGCQKGDTIGTCQARPENSAYTASLDGVFDYSGGHMQRHATLIGLGPLNGVALAKDMRTVLGSDLKLLYSPQVAAGATISSDDYAKILRKVLRGELKMAGQLGTSPVCTNPRTCSQARLTPVPTNESWHYSVGHWVEDDPTVGDGAFSSAGAFGFYPWIDQSKTYYGVLGRFDTAGSNAGYKSAQCGRLVRKAYITGVAS